MECLPGWGISSMPGPPPRQHEHDPRQHEHERLKAYTPFTQPFILTRRIWKDDYEDQMIFGDLVGLIKIKSVALQLRRAKTDWSSCYQMAVPGALWLAKRLSFNLNFSFLNRISLLLIWSSYPIVLTRLGGPLSSHIASRKISRV